MYILVVSIICAIMLAGVRQLAYNNPIENIVLAFLLFVSIDTILRGILNKPSWIVTMRMKKKSKK
jgi:hypothetical protein